MDRRFDSHDVRRMDNVHNSSSTLPRQTEFRHRTSSESFSQGWESFFPAVCVCMSEEVLQLGACMTCACMQSLQCVCVCVCVCMHVHVCVCAHAQAHDLFNPNYSCDIYRPVRVFFMMVLVVMELIFSWPWSHFKVTAVLAITAESTLSQSHSQWWTFSYNFLSDYVVLLFQIGSNPAKSRTATNVCLHGHSTVDIPSPQHCFSWY